MSLSLSFLSHALARSTTSELEISSDGTKKRTNEWVYGRGKTGKAHTLAIKWNILWPFRISTKVTTMIVTVAFNFIFEVMKTFLILRLPHVIRIRVTFLNEQTHST